MLCRAVGEADWGIVKPTLLIRPPCVKGAVGEADWGIVNHLKKNYFKCFIYADGVVPVSFLNVLQKCDCEENPRYIAISE